MRHLLLMPLFAAAFGCGGKPSAPALTADEEYFDANAGIRFPTPAGYRIFVKAELPKGAIEKPVMLAAYQNTRAKARSAIEVMAADVPEGQDLTDYLRLNPVGSDKWKPKSPAEALTVGGRPGVRLAYGYRDAEREHTREVTAVRNGGRAIFVIVIYPPDDPAARDAGRAVVDRIEWLPRG